MTEVLMLLLVADCIVTGFYLTSLSREIQRVRELWAIQDKIIQLLIIREKELDNDR